MDFGNNVAAEPLAEDPSGGHSEPNLTPPLSATPNRLGIYGDHGDTEEAYLTEVSQRENLRRQNGAKFDDVDSILRHLRRLESRRLYIGPFVWTTADSLIRCTVPIDRLPINATLYRAIAMLTDASAVANEVIVLTDLLSVPIRLNPTRDISTQQSVYPVIDLPFKTEGFSITKQGGGAFTSVGALWLDIREVNLV